MNFSELNIFNINVVNNELNTTEIISGIYTITNSFDNKIYVGSSENIYLRLKQHKNKLISNKHSNKHLQYAYNKYKGDFRFEVLILIDIKLLESEETYWINVLQSNNRKFGYNINPSGYSRTKLSQETKDKISVKATGRKLSQETIEKLVLKNTGQVRKNQSIKMKNRWDATKQYFGINNLSEDKLNKVKEKLSIAAKNRYKDDNNIKDNTFIKVIDSVGNIKVFRSLKRASHALNVDKKTIKSNINKTIRKLNVKIEKIESGEYHRLK